VKIYVAAVVEALRKNRKDRMKLSLSPKLMVFSGKRKDRMKLSLPPKLMVFSGKRKDRMKLSLPPKLMVFSEFHPPLEC
jgi:hypothetical protein